MPESTWIATRNRKKRKWYSLILPLVFAGVCAAVIIRNNTEFFAPARSPHDRRASRDTVAVAVPARASETPMPTRRDVQPRKAASDDTAVVRGADMERKEYVLRDISCMIQSEKKVPLRFSLNCFVESDAAVRELLFKREELKTLARSVMEGRRLETLQIDRVRGEMLARLNGILEKGTIVDLEFTDFTLAETDTE